MSKEMPTIPEMVEQTPQGETRLFEAPIRGATEDRFFRVGFNFDYNSSFNWKIDLDYTEIPRMGIRGHPRGSISVIPEPKLSTKSKGSRLVDYYEREDHLFFLSNRLMELFGKIDPGSLECRPVVIHAKDGPVDFNLAVPLRNLEAVDLERTDVLIEGTQLGKYWTKTVRFPNIVVFQKQPLTGVHNFSDIDVFGWFWSRELIVAARDAGVRGLAFRRAGDSLAFGAAQYRF